MGMIAKVNYNAQGTWLEPYIGHEFDIIWETVWTITFWINYDGWVKTEELKIYFDLSFKKQ